MSKVRGNEDRRRGKIHSDRNRRFRLRFGSLDDRLAVLVVVSHALVHQPRCEEQDTQGQS